MKNIKNDIKTGEYKRVYLLYGSENYLKQLYSDKLKKALIPDDDNMNLTVIRGDSFDFNEFKSMCDTMPFFADRRLVLVNRCGKFKLSKKDGSDDDKKDKESGKDPFADYLREIPDTTVVVFVEDEADKRGRAFKAVKETGYVCEMNSLDEKDLLLWIGTEFKAIGKSISAATASYLTEWSGTDMGNLKIEIEKLGFFALDRPSIEKSDIESICTRQLKAVIFDLTDAIAAGDKHRALRVYDELNALRQPIQLTWRMLIKHYTQLLVTKELKAAGRSADEITRTLSVHPFVTQKLMRQVGSFKTSAIRRKLEFGVQLEQDFKVGKIDEKNIVELFVMQ
jgi:DNA polymerase-3 subunit delta